jgi:hypothetical protein
MSTALAAKIEKTHSYVQALLALDCGEIEIMLCDEGGVHNISSDTLYTGGMNLQRVTGYCQAFALAQIQINSDKTNETNERNLLGEHYDAAKFYLNDLIGGVRNIRGELTLSVRSTVEMDRA